MQPFIFQLLHAGSRLEQLIVVLQGCVTKFLFSSDNKLL